MDPNEAGVPTPTICRVVIYRDDDGRDCPAIVTQVDGLPAGDVHLIVFPPGEHSHPALDVPCNDPASGDIAPCTWRWPVVR